MDSSFPRNVKNGFQLSLWLEEAGVDEGDFNGQPSLLGSIITPSPGCGLSGFHSFAFSSCSDLLYRFSPKC